MQRLSKPLQFALFGQKFTTFNKAIQAAEAKKLAYRATGMSMFSDNTSADANHVMAFQSSNAKKALKQFKLSNR